MNTSYTTSLPRQFRTIPLKETPSISGNSLYREAGTLKKELSVKARLNVVIDGSVFLSRGPDSSVRWDMADQGDYSRSNRLLPCLSRAWSGAGFGSESLGFKSETQ